MKDFIFKSLKYEDLERVMEIEKTSFSKNTWEDKKVYEERINIFPEGNIGIWVEGLMIGFISSELWKYQENYGQNRFMLSHSIKDYHDYFGTELYISSFAIDTAYRGNGYGEAIFEAFLDKMREKYNLKSGILLVSSEWKNAKKIYEKYGYKSLENISNFFINDLEEKFDGIIMRKFF
ncbi:MAG: GNAT family N-acetyltransferase [Fusobacteriaceae bacterium]|nr:GNAT family N-acetyltransferase [Fusobacteriaceae bacterium]